VKSAAERLARAQEALWRRLPMLRPSARPSMPEQDRLILGREKDGAPFPLDARLLAAHMDLVGGTGAGKSTLMRHLSWSHMASSPRLNRATVIIDPHGGHPDSLLRSTLRRIVETRLYERKRVYVIDANSRWCTGLRLLHGSADPSVTADHLIEAFERLQDDQSLFEKPTLRRALHGLLAVLSELNWSLAQADLLLDPRDPHGIREWGLQQISDRYAIKAMTRLQHLAQDPRLMKEFEIETVGTENRMAPVLSSRAMRTIVGSQMIDMRDILDQGAVLLVNTAGGDAASEIAGDLLGKLVMRAIVFAAKRRRSDSLAMIFADECARYVSQDWERALAELRKFSCCLCSAHQTFAMLGKPDDPVRQAVEKIPATKIAMRMNSMKEAADWAPEIMHLNLEMPVEALTKPVVVGHKRIWLDNESLGLSAGIGSNISAGTTSTQSAEVGESTANTRGRNYTKTYSSSETRSESDTDAENWSETETVGSNWSETDTTGESESQTCSAGVSRGGTHSEGLSESAGSGTSDTYGSSAARSGSASRSDSRGVSRGYSLSYDQDNVGKISSGKNATPNGGTESSGSNANSGTAQELGWSEGQNRSRGTSHSEGKARTSSDARSYQESASTALTRGSNQSHASTVGGSHSYASTRGGSHAHTVCYAQTTGESDSFGTSEAETMGTSRSTGTAHGVTKTAGLNLSFGASKTSGRTEALEPILKDKPGAVHSLENLRHLAAERLCALPVGVAVVRTIRDGKLEGAVVRIPFRACDPVSDEQYTKDLDLVMHHGGIGKPMTEAMRELEERERALVGTAQTLRLPPPEPKSYRVPAPKPRTDPSIRSHGQPRKSGAQAVKGGPSAVAAGERDP
jgi:hypothetical protein